MHNILLPVWPSGDFRDVLLLLWFFKLLLVLDNIIELLLTKSILKIALKKRNVAPSATNWNKQVLAKVSSSSFVIPFCCLHCVFDSVLRSSLPQSVLLVMPFTFSFVFSISSLIISFCSAYLSLQFCLNVHLHQQYSKWEVYFERF